MNAASQPSLSDVIAAYLDLYARQGQSISYAALAQAFNLRISQVTQALEILMEREAAQGEPLRAALCAAKLGNGLPARGFFEKAAALGRDVADPAAFILRERRALFDRAHDRASMLPPG